MWSLILLAAVASADISITRDESFDAMHHTLRYKDHRPVSQGAEAGVYHLPSLGSTPVVRRGAPFSVVSSAPLTLMVLKSSDDTTGKVVSGVRVVSQTGHHTYSNVMIGGVDEVEEVATDLMELEDVQAKGCGVCTYKGITSPCKERTHWLEDHTELQCLDALKRLHTDCPHACGLCDQRACKWKPVPPPKPTSAPLPPADASAPIGWYMLRNSKGEELRFIVLFNPWSKALPEYVPDDDKRFEYVENDYGVTFQGSLGSHGGTHWHLDQHRGSNLVTAVDIISQMDLSERGDPALVTRHIVSYIRTDVCDAKWEGPYTTGCEDSDGNHAYCCAKDDWANNWPRRCNEPTRLSSSTPLLEQFAALYAKNPSGGAAAHGARWCQCWVLGALTSTVGRAVGIATRQVTTFNSADDQNGDRAVSEFYVQAHGRGQPFVPVEINQACGWCDGLDADIANEHGCNLMDCYQHVTTGMGFADHPECEACMPCIPCSAAGEMVWNFHSWNEVYLHRTEITTANTKDDGVHLESSVGWNAADATYKLGPSAKNLIIDDKDSCWDTNFIIGEVNSWNKLFVYELDEGIDPQSIKPEKMAWTLEHKAKFVRTAGDPLFMGKRFTSHPWKNKDSNIGSGIVTKRPGDVSQECTNYGRCEQEQEDITLTYKRAEPSSPEGPMFGPRDVCPHLKGENSNKLRSKPLFKTGALEAPEVPFIDNDHVHFDASSIRGELHLGTPFNITLLIQSDSDAKEAHKVNCLLMAQPFDAMGRQVKNMSLPLGADGSTVIMETLTVEPGKTVAFTRSVVLEEAKLAKMGLTSDNMSVISFVVSAATDHHLVHDRFVAKPRIFIAWSKAATETPSTIVI